MNNPELDDEFTEWATCPAGHRGEVDFHFNHGSASAPVGTCDHCEVVFSYDAQGEEAPVASPRRVRLSTGLLNYCPECDSHYDGRSLCACAEEAS